MKNNQDLHQPILAWEWHTNHYALMSDGVAVGTLHLLNNLAEAEHGSQRWKFAEAGPSHYVAIDQQTSEPAAEIQLANPPCEQEERPLEITDGKEYRMVFNRRLQPALTTTRSPDGTPLLQYRPETNENGRIQVDNSAAVSHPDFPLICLFGLYLALVTNRVPTA